MAKPAGLDLGAQRARGAAAPDIAGFGVGQPGRIAPLAKSLRQSHGRVIDLSERPPAVFAARPTDMAGALTMASLAANADFRKRRRELVVRRVIILPDAGGVALRAHEIPVLVEPGPMQHIVVADFLVRIEVKPVLTAFLFRPAIPRDRQ